MRRMAIALLVVVSVACSDDPPATVCAGVGLEGPVAPTDLGAVEAFLETQDDSDYSVGDEGIGGYEIVDHDR